MTRYAVTLAIAVALAIGLSVYAGMSATHATLALEQGRELSLADQVFIASGNFVARWHVVLVVLLLAGAIAVARHLGPREGRAAQ
jgi:hypothetical protein